MRADDWLLWIIRLALIFGLIFAMGLFVSMVRDTFLQTHHTETLTLMHESMMLLVSNQDDTLAKGFPIVHPSDFRDAMLEPINSSTAIKAELINSSGDVLATAYLNKDAYDLYDPLVFAGSWVEAKETMHVLIRNADHEQLGKIVITGVYRK